MWCSQALCGQSWAALGPAVACPGSLLAEKWPFLEREGGPKSLLGPLWAVVGCSWGLCGRSWATLGAYVGCPGAVLAEKWPWLEREQDLGGRSWPQSGPFSSGSAPGSA